MQWCYQNHAEFCSCCRLQIEMLHENQLPTFERLNDDETSAFEILKAKSVYFFFFSLLRLQGWYNFVL